MAAPGVLVLAGMRWDPVTVPDRAMPQICRLATQGLPGLCQLLSAVDEQKPARDLLACLWASTGSDAVAS